MLLHQRGQDLSFRIVVEPQGKVNKQTGKDAAEERTLSVKAYGFARFPKGERTLSVCSLRSQPAPPKGELFGIFRQVEQNLPLRGRWHGASRDGEGSARLRQAALPPQRRAFAESGAADDYPFRHRLRRCHTPPFVAARHLPPAGEGFSGGGKVSGSTQRPPLGGAGALAPEGVPPPVKMQSRSVRRRSGFALSKIIFPLFMRKAARRAFQIVPLPASHFSASASLHSTQCRGRNSRHAGGAAV